MNPSNNTLNGKIRSRNIFSAFVRLFTFSLIDFNTRNRRETEAETERIRTSQTAAERALEAREKAHRARVKSLEEQVRDIRFKIEMEIEIDIDSFRSRR